MKIFKPSLLAVLILSSLAHLCDNPLRAADETLNILPADEGHNNASFKNFRQNLINAVNKKDTAFLLRHTDENICFTFSMPPEKQNKENFLKFWDLDTSPRRSMIWRALDEVIKLGGVFEKDGSFTAPYTFAKFPDDMDGFTSLVCISENVPLYKNPSADDNPAATLHYDIVLPVGDAREGSKKSGENSQWRKVKTLSGIEGYVMKKYLRSPIDYRATFHKKSGVWKMTNFIAGD